MANRQGEVQKLIKLAEKNGWTAVKRTRGVTLRAPDGVTTVSAHYSHSDVRSIKNMKAALKRAGLKL